MDRPTVLRKVLGDAPSKHAICQLTDRSLNNLQYT